jgi:polysaccharide export outer membrane protein
MRATRLLVAFLIVLVAAGCAGRRTADIKPARVPLAEASARARAATQVRPTALAAEPSYTLDSGDKLRIVVFGQDGLTSSYAVDTGGNVIVPLIGTVRARGLTTAQLAQDITAKLRDGFIREPHVAVEIEAYRPFFILGEVTAPGQYPYVANMSVETAVAIAGGFTARAQKNRVEISRPFEGQIFRNFAPLNAAVRPGDTVVVGERWF